MPRASSSISSESPSQPGNVRCALPGSRSDRGRRCRSRRARPRAPGGPGRRAARRPGGVLGLVLDRQLDRGREPGDRRGVDGAAADVALLAAAVHQRGDARPRGVRRARRRRTGRRPCARSASARRRRRRRSRPGPRRPPARRRCAPGCRARPAIATTSAIGWRVPTSLLAHITETSATSSGSRSTASRSASRSRRPCRSTGSSSTSAPSRSPSQCSGSSTAWCSTARGEDPDAARVGVAARPVDALEREVVGLGAAGGEHDLARTAVRGPARSSRGTPPRPGGRAGPEACSELGLPTSRELRGHRLDGRRAASAWSRRGRGTPSGS